MKKKPKKLKQPRIQREVHTVYKGNRVKIDINALSVEVESFDAPLSDVFKVADITARNLIAGVTKGKSIKERAHDAGVR